ncbi:MAG TPA: cell division protein FtsA [Bacteroidaceae bacterium]|nr:cell division protein FtsA [Bacteroidaceae bacterium]
MGVNKLIVAIELGSSKISGAVGQKYPDGSLKVWAYASTPSFMCIHHGVVYNLDKTANAIVEVINKLEITLNNVINRVFIGYNGKSLRSIPITIQRELDEANVITPDIIDDMELEAENMLLEEFQLLQMESAEYVADYKNSTELDPIGVAAHHLEGRYQNIVIKSQVMKFLVQCFKLASIEISDGFVTPISLANSILTNEEKRQGCLLVDYGADTTTVSIYKNGFLRYLRVLPMGSDLITKDIMRLLQMERDDAEMLKTTYGLYNLVDNKEKEEKVRVKDKNIILKELGEIIDARNEEIMLNVAHQVRNAGFGDSLFAGIVMTGGGSNLRKLESVIHQIFPLMCTPRFVKQPPFRVSWANPVWENNNGTQVSLLSLLALGDEECCEKRIDEELMLSITPEQEQSLKPGNLFDDKGESAQIERDRKAIEEREAAKEIEAVEKKSKTPSRFMKILNLMINAGDEFFKDEQ